ncbi:MAG TPA: hypothetical protein VMF67_17760 [Rhizomicrobium sp.]|nr:hypothetical protein [Rhizomicrobium sp.]
MNRATGTWPRRVTGAILVAAWIATVVISWPGHLSYDSIIQLHDGRMGFYHSWHPPVMAWLLGVGDAVWPGAGLFMLLDTALFFGALLSLVWTVPRVSWAAAVVAALVALLPQTVLYQTIVWKDVLFADAAVAGFACLAQAALAWPNARARMAWIGGALALFILATLTRQNGLIVLFLGGLALGLTAWRQGDRPAGLRYAGSALAGAVAISLTLSFALSLRSDGGEGPRAQLKLLRLYDVVGAVAAHPSLPLDRLDVDDPELERLIRSDGVRLYTPERNDTLVGSQALQNELADAEPQWLAAQWYDLMRRHPWLYLKTRATVFAQVLFTPDIAGCRPVFVGIEGPAGEMGDLNIAPRKDARDLALQAYARAFTNTPVFSHALYVLLAVAGIVMLLRRRALGDEAIVSMLIAALLFTASFFVISIACDYRYLYFLDLAAIVAVFYLALDPAYLFQVVAIWSGSFWELLSDARKS